MMLSLAQLPVWVTGLLVALFLFVCVLLILIVLIQRPTGGGLVGAFGSGAGSGQTAFGTKTGDALTIATIAMFTIYLLFAIGLNYAVRPPKAPPQGSPEAQQTPGTAPTTPAAPATGEGAAPATTPDATTAPLVPAPAPTGEAPAGQPAATPPATTPPAAQPETQPAGTAPVPAPAPAQPAPAPAGQPK